MFSPTTDWRFDKRSSLGRLIIFRIRRLIQTITLASRSWCSPWSCVNRTAQSSSTITQNEPLTGAIVPLTVSEEGLTKFQETTTTLISDAGPPSSQDRQISVANPDQTPTGILTRKYQVASFSWSPTFTGTTLRFPELLLSNTTIQNALKNFKYFRAKVNLEIRINSTQFHQGVLGVSWLPVIDASYANGLTDLRILSGFNYMTISASNQDSLSFTLPYLHPLDWLTTTPVAADSRIGAVKIFPVVNLIPTIANMPIALPVLVYASFDDVHTEGFIAQSSSKDKFKPNKEAQKKAQKGLDAISAVSGISKMFRHAPVIGTAYGAVADFLNAFAGDLSKPLDNSPAPSYTYFESGSVTAGLDKADQTSIYPNAYLHQAPLMLGMETTHMSASQLAMRPQLSHVFTFTSLSSSDSVTVNPYVPHPSFASDDYLSTVSRSFKYWRGSVKYLYHFVIPAFYSLRVQFVLNYNPAGGVSNLGDVSSKIVDIKGDTWVEISVPYVRPTTWSPVAQNDPFAPVLTVVPLTNIIGSSLPSVPVCPVIVYRAGGEDMRFQQLVHAGFIAQSSLNDKFSKPFDTFHSGVMQSTEQGLVAPEPTPTICDIQKRKSGTTRSGPNLTYPGAVGLPDLLQEPFHYFARNFTFFRGSRILTHYQPSTLVTLDPGRSGSPNFGNGAALWFPSDLTPYNLMKEHVSVPYYSAVPFFPIPTYPAHPSSTSFAPTDLLTGTIATSLVINAGDDFVMLQVHPTLQPPPTAVTTPETTTVSGGTKTVNTSSISPFLDTSKQS